MDAKLEISAAALMFYSQSEICMLGNNYDDTAVVARA